LLHLNLYKLLNRLRSSFY